MWIFFCYGDHLRFPIDKKNQILLRTIKWYILQRWQKLYIVKKCPNNSKKSQSDVFSNKILFNQQPTLPINEKKNKVSCKMQSHIPGLYQLNLLLIAILSRNSCSNLPWRSSNSMYCALKYICIIVINCCRRYTLIFSSHHMIQLFSVNQTRFTDEKSFKITTENH